MKLPLADRIRKRKAIKDVYLVRDYCEPTKDREYLYKVKISKNLSDFKEGDPLLLHEDGEYNGMKCTLYSFEEEGVICVSVSLYDRKYDLEPFYDVPLVLDKDAYDEVKDFRYFISAWNDNTNNNDTDDVIKYQLKPIYVIGGIAGRVVASNATKNGTKVGSEFKGIKTFFLG